MERHFKFVLFHVAYAQVVEQRGGQGAVDVITQEFNGCFVVFNGPVIFLLPDVDAGHVVEEFYFICGTDPARFELVCPVHHFQCFLIILECPNVIALIEVIYTDKIEQVRLHHYDFDVRGVCIQDIVQQPLCPEQVVEGDGVAPACPVNGTQVGIDLGFRGIRIKLFDERIGLLAVIDGRIQVLVDVIRG